METRETIIRTIEKLADFQMRKSTHIRFLENCVTESVVPKGLKLQLQVQVGENTRLQKAVDDILRKTLMEITRLVSDEHYQQLQESKPKMTVLEDKLRKFTKDEGEFNIITHNIFTKTEAKKNKIIDKQAKKLGRLTDTRDCYIDHVSQSDKSKSEMPQASQTNAKQKTKDDTKPRGSTGNSEKKKPKQGSKKNSKKPVITPNPQKQQPDEKRTSNESKNEVAPSSTKMSYSKAVTTGQPRQPKQGKEQVQHQTGMQKQLSSVIEQLVSCLKALNGTGGSSASPAEKNGENKRKFKKKYNGENRQF